MPLNDVLKKLNTRTKEPLWKGPYEDGITFSMLSQFLVCRERFRLRNIVGLKQKREFVPKTGFGNMWHVCEEHVAKCIKQNKDIKGWEKSLLQYSKQLCKHHIHQQSTISKWYDITKLQFKIYLNITE